ncbi:MAG TPA: HAD family hydrolase [Caulobacteraceae bacterium]|nr:HAD family hydrolase [Caulobacteraceae bacterium]
MSLKPGSLAGATVALDLDGTLVDTAPDLVGALNAILAEEGLPTLELAKARLMVGRGARALVEMGFAAAGRTPPPDRMREVVRRFIDIYLDRIALESRPFPGLEAALDALTGAGARLCVCTNKFTNLSVALLEGLDLARYFAAVTGPDAAPAPKPDPRHLIAAVEAAGGTIGRAVMVGDSAADVGVARAAGAPSIVVTFGYTEIAPAELGGDHLIERYAELPPLIESLLGRG